MKLCYVLQGSLFNFNRPLFSFRYRKKFDSKSKKDSKFDFSSRVGNYRTSISAR